MQARQKLLGEEVKAIRPGLMWGGVVDGKGSLDAGRLHRFINFQWWKLGLYLLTNRGFLWKNGFCQGILPEHVLEGLGTKKTLYIIDCYLYYIYIYIIYILTKILKATKYYYTKIYNKI